MEDLLKRQKSPLVKYRQKTNNLKNWKLLNSVWTLLWRKKGSTVNLYWIIVHLPGQILVCCFQVSNLQTIIKNNLY